MTWQIAFRTDADAEIGGGHFMRCLTLAMGCLDRGGRSVFFTNTTSIGLRKRAISAGVELYEFSHDGPGSIKSDLVSWVEDHHGAWVVLDGYEFDDALQLDLARAGGRLMVIDDYARLPIYHAALVLDQNIGAENKQYPIVAGGRTLLGPSYALVRPEFVAARQGNRQHKSQALRVLVTLGAADPGDSTSLVIEALIGDTTPDLEVTVVLGAANASASAARYRAEQAGFRVLSDVLDMAQLMAEADVAVSSAGTTLWELCCMGLPTITLVIAENQRSSAVALERAGITVNLGWHKSVSPTEIAEAVNALCSNWERRIGMSKKGQELVDGRGVERVVCEILGEAS